MPTQDNSGTIENEELKGFLKDLLELVKKVGTLLRLGNGSYIILAFPGRLRCPGSGCFRGDHHAGSWHRQAWKDLPQRTHHDPADTGQNIPRRRGVSRWLEHIPKRDFSQLYFCHPIEGNPDKRPTRALRQLFTLELHPKGSEKKILVSGDDPERTGIQTETKLLVTQI